MQFNTRGSSVSHFSHALKISDYVVTAAIMRSIPQICVSHISFTKYSETMVAYSVVYAFLFFQLTPLAKFSQQAR